MKLESVIPFGWSALISDSMNSSVASLTKPNKRRVSKKELTTIESEDKIRQNATHDALHMLNLSNCKLEDYDLSNGWFLACSNALSLKMLIEAKASDRITVAIDCILGKYPPEPVLVKPRDLHKHDNIHKFFGNDLAVKLRCYSNAMGTHYVGDSMKI